MDDFTVYRPVKEFVSRKKVVEEYGIHPNKYGIGERLSETIQIIFPALKDGFKTVAKISLPSGKRILSSTYR